ncbi:protein of unknown function [Micropruina glycogenica]|uniref:Uncharacterized protein n=1 Tax=Micropruina glycogenica TaxID=75385 RepID=A0A2N9JLL7_9ACTN|nr:protein of unknown function [Micropruina glycogenica]
MNTRPVRLAPCAAGASPTISTRGCSSPNEGAARPQYGWSANDARRSVATCSRHATSRGQARQTETRASRVGRSGDDVARACTSSEFAAAGVAVVAGSPGQPVPGVTGDEKGSLVSGCASIRPFRIATPRPHCSSRHFVVEKKAAAFPGSGIRRLVVGIDTRPRYLFQP